jgi:tRNA (cytidine/uridine-2'-O-)-methyltransferase
VNVVLIEPEIPPNTGNVARLCAATGTTLHLIEPFGFELDDRQLKRAGLDYWRHLDWYRWPDWPAFQRQLPGGARLWLIESHGTRHYAEVEYKAGDYLVFGRETAGLPRKIVEQYGGTWLRLPMFHPEVRSLNLSNCVAVVLYEALRQHGFRGEI